MREPKFVHHHLDLVLDKVKHGLRRLEKMKTGLESEGFPGGELEASNLLGDSRPSSRHLMRTEKSERQQVNPKHQSILRTATESTNGPETSPLLPHSHNLALAANAEPEQKEPLRNSTEQYADP